MKPLAPNTLLQNRYLIVHLIGKGGMGEVYLAIDQRLGSAVALKRTLHGDDATLGEAFEREARTLARLRHPVLPKVSDHFIENENQYLVMEHISGDDLAKRLTATGKPFPLSWVLYWADQLLDALAYLHSHEPPIIHRDIKPQNLKLTDENNIVLLDFGLSKNTTGPANVSGSTGGSTGSVVGYTPHYAPMEQIRGTGTNPRSDIYSLSATLYQLLTNVVPPDALSRADFLLSGKTDPITSIEQINREIPKSISDIILKGMSISQDNRYADAREMQRILRETYARIQSEADDKTIAFNVESEHIEPVVEPVAVIEDKTEQYSAEQLRQFSAPPADDQSALKEAMGAQTIPFGMVIDTAGQNVVEAPSLTDKTEQIQDFDATIRIDSEPHPTARQNVPDTLVAPVEPTPESVAPVETPPTYVAPIETPPTYVAPIETPPVAADTPQSNIKTEVFGGGFGAAEYLRNDQTAPADNFNAPPTAGESAPDTGFTGDKTVPFIQLDNQPAGFVDPGQTQPVSAFDSQPQTENKTAENDFMATDGAVEMQELITPGETSLPAENYGVPDSFHRPVQEPPPPADNRPAPPPVAPVKKKSKALIFGILGALFGLAVLAGAAGIGVWYMMNQPSTDSNSNVASPTPTPAVSPTPTPESSNTNSGGVANGSSNANSNSNAANTTVDNTAVNAAPSPDKTKPVVVETPITQPTKNVPTPRPTTQIPVNTPRPPTPRPTGKPDVKPTPRGGLIPQ